MLREPPDPPPSCPPPCPNRRPPRGEEREIHRRSTLTLAGLRRSSASAREAARRRRGRGGAPARRRWRCGCGRSPWRRTWPRRRGAGACSCAPRACSSSERWRLRVATPIEQVRPFRWRGSSWMSPGRGAEGGLDHRAADLLGEVDGALEVAARQQQHELVAAVAGGDAVHLGHEVTAQHEAHLAQHLAAGEMAVGVVDPLEEVEVEEEDREVQAPRARSGGGCRRGRRGGSGRCRGRSGCRAWRSPAPGGRRARSGSRSRCSRRRSPAGCGPRRCRPAPGGG